MELVSLTCPCCGYSKELPASMIPPLGTRTTCPRCEQGFELQDINLSHRRESAAGETAAPDSGDAQPRDDREAWLEQAPPDQLAPSRRPTRTHTFTFTGSGKEYFNIWIVNTLLRIVTLGLYSPWAKVRKRRYFYGNTLLNDAPFDYLADPLAILKGWFIAGLFFGAYSFAAQVNPIIGAVFMIVMFALFPWVLVRSYSFNLRNSSHRNIRFAFRTDYREAYRVFLWWQLLVPLTLGILGPYVVYRQKRFLVENSSYGTAPFSFHATPRQYYRLFLPLFILIPVLAAFLGGLAYLGQQAGQQALKGNPLLSLVPFVILIAIYFVAGLYIPTAMANLSWNSTEIGGNRFVSTLRVRDLLWIYLSNAVAIMFSLGLLAPWTAVRLARYRIDKLALRGQGDFDSIAAGNAETVGATGEELGDMLGFDFGL